MEKLKDLKEKIREMSRDPELVAGACYTGITEMFRTSWFPILPRVLIEKGIAPNEWFRVARQSSPGVSLSLVERCSGGSPMKAIRRLKIMGLPYEEPREISEHFSQILNWERLLESISDYSETIKNLGLLWYLHIVLGSEEEVLEIVKELEISLDEVDVRVGELVEFLNEKTSVQVAREKQPLVKWNDVFRSPV